MDALQDGWHRFCCTGLHLEFHHLLFLFRMSRCIFPLRWKQMYLYKQQEYKAPLPYIVEVQCFCLQNLLPKTEGFIIFYYNQADMS